eukprot:2363976-Rhodomonas_salina.1
MRIHVWQLPTSDPADVKVELGANTSVTSLTADGSGLVILSLLVPSTLLPRSVYPTLHLRSGASIRCEYPFEYLPAAPITVKRVTPNQVSMFSQNRVRIQVKNFPRAADKSKVQITFSWAGGTQASAAVEEVTLADDSQTALSAQDLVIDVLTPTGGSVKEGMSQLRITHLDFSSVFVSSANAVNFVNPSQPAVTQLSTEWGSVTVTSAVRVGANLGNAVTILLKEVPASASTRSLRTQIDSVGAQSLFADINTETRGAKLIVEAPPADEGLVWGFVAFGVTA